MENEILCLECRFMETTQLFLKRFFNFSLALVPNNWTFAKHKRKTAKKVINVKSLATIKDNRLFSMQRKTEKKLSISECVWAGRPKQRVQTFVRSHNVKICQKAAKERFRMNTSAKLPKYSLLNQSNLVYKTMDSKSWATSILNILKELKKQTVAPIDTSVASFRSKKRN